MKNVKQLRLYYVTGDLELIGKNLTSLNGSPQKVVGSFSCGDNLIETLKGGPREVTKHFSCTNNPNLRSLEGAPEKVGGHFFASQCKKLTSLEGIHRQVKEINGALLVDMSPIKSHVLGVLLIQGLSMVRLDNRRVEDILNKHLPSQGMRSLLLAQEELLDAGLEEFAKL